MAYDTETQDAIDRLANFYNGGAYDAGTNPGGMGQGGHRSNFPAAIQDIARVVEFVGPAAQEAVEAAQDVDEVAFYYLGAQAADPTTMRDGSPLVAGAYYLNTGTDRVRYYDGGSWIEITMQPPYWSDPTEIDHTDSPYSPASSAVLKVATSGGGVVVTLPAAGRVAVQDTTNSASVNNITVAPPAGDSIMGQAADETFVIDISNFACVFERGANGDWRVS